MKRVIALVVAIGLIVGAVLIRRAIDDDTTATPSARPRGVDLVLVCAVELRDACEALDDVTVRIEDAAVTAAALSAGPSDVDAWAVPAPWPAIVDDTRARAGLEPLFDTGVEPVATSPIVAIGPVDLHGCDWRCIGDRANDDLDFGAPASSSGVGLLQVGALATGWFGTSDFATNDFDPAFTQWLQGIAAATTVTDEPVTRLLQSRAFFDVALSYQAEASPAFDTASEDRRAGLDLLYPAPVAYLDVLVVGIGGAPGDLASTIGESLVAEHGWQPIADEPNNLPRAGVLVALRDLL